MVSIKEQASLHEGNHNIGNLVFFHSRYMALFYQYFFYITFIIKFIIFPTFNGGHILLFQKEIKLYFSIVLLSTPASIAKW